MIWVIVWDRPWQMFRTLTRYKVLLDGFTNNSETHRKARCCLSATFVELLLAYSRYCFASLGLEQPRRQGKAKDSQQAEDKKDLSLREVTDYNLLGCDPKRINLRNWKPGLLPFLSTHYQFSFCILPPDLSPPMPVPSCVSKGHGELQSKTWAQGQNFELLTRHPLDEMKQTQSPQ